MFQIQDVIIYGSAGVCKITDIETKTVGGAQKQYFVLKPVNDPGATIFAPKDNPHILKKMRRLLNQEEIYALIDSMPKEASDWIPGDNERKEFFKSVLAGGDHLELIKMIKSIYIHQKAREAEGKRLHMSDERFFKDAELALYNEFQYVLNLKSRDDLMRCILDRIAPQSE